MKAIIIALVLAVALAGCLNGFAKPTASPTPIPTTEATPTPQVTVTTQIVYVTVTPTPLPVTPTPLPVVTGGVKVVNEYVENTSADLSTIANSDYHLNPFVANSGQGTALAELTAGRHDWNGIPFVFAQDHKTAGSWTVLTTTDSDFFGASANMKNQYYSKIYLVVAGSYGPRTNRTLARIFVHYGDGSSQMVPLISGVNVWNLDDVVPQDYLFWKSSDGKEQLAVVGIALTQPLVKVSNVEIRKVEAGNDGVAVFAVTGQRMLKTKRFTFTPKELGNPANDRDNAGVDSFGLSLTFKDKNGVRTFAPNGTMKFPTYDAETHLVNFVQADWDADLPAGTQIKIEARVGPRPKFDIDWSDWFDLVKGQPFAKKEQYYALRVTLFTSNPSVTPILKQLGIDYVNPA